MSGPYIKPCMIIMLIRLAYLVSPTCPLSLLPRPCFPQTASPLRFAASGGLQIAKPLGLTFPINMWFMYYDRLVRQLHSRGTSDMRKPITATSNAVACAPQAHPRKHFGVQGACGMNGLVDDCDQEMLHEALTEGPAGSKGPLSP